MKKLKDLTWQDLDFDATGRRECYRVNPNMGTWDLSVDENFRTYISGLHSPAAVLLRFATILIETGDDVAAMHLVGFVREASESKAPWPSRPEWLAVQGWQNANKEDNE